MRVNELLSWGLPTALVLGCITFAFAALTIGEIDVDDFWLARGFFITAALVGIARITYWGLTTHRPIAARIVVSIIACGLLTAFAIESVRYVNRKHTRWLQRQSTSKDRPRESATKDEQPIENIKHPEPNFVCMRTGIADAHHEYGALMAGKSQVSGENFSVAVVEICNEFSAQRKVGHLREVSAEIDYSTRDGRVFKVKRGSWLSESAYQLAYSVNDRQELILAGFTQGGDHPVLFALSRELKNWEESIADRAIFLAEDAYDIKVRLIKESAGTVHKEFNFVLEVTREPEFEVRLRRISTATEAA